MNAIDEVAVLDHLYLLNVNEPSEKWAEVAQSPLRPEIHSHLEACVEAQCSAQMLGFAMVACLFAIGCILALAFSRF